jgi:hypothetical protein
MLTSRSQEADQGSPLRSPATARTAVLLLGAAAVAWAGTVERMRGMDAGPHTNLGAFGWYLGSWATMTAEMMLPSAAPTAPVLERVTRRSLRSSNTSRAIGAGLARFAIR